MSLDPPDRVDRILAQWGEHRADLDFTGAALTLRLVLLGKFVEQHAAATFAPFGLQTWEFDVLAALRREGPPFALIAGDLARNVLLTCSGMSHRLNRLEDRGLVERVTEAGDRRRVLVRLTESGRTLTDRVLTQRTCAVTELLECLEDGERRTLESLLRRLQRRFEEPCCTGSPQS